MEWSLVGQFWAIALALALTPGADWAYAIASGLRARSAAPSVLGMACGYVVVVVAVAVGIGALMAACPVALTALTLAGAGYLILLGCGALLSRAEQLRASDRALGDDVAVQFARGAGVAIINPKGVLLLIALLPQFTSATGWPSAAQMLVLGGLHVLDITVIYFGVALGARRLLSARPRASAAVTRVSGVLMILLGGGILVEQLVGML